MCRPSGSTGFSAASPSSVVSRSPWSRVHEPGLAGRLAVLVEDRRVQRGDLALEPPLVHGHPRLALRGEPEGLEVVAGQARGCARSGRRPRTGWACRWSSRRDAGRRAPGGTLRAERDPRHRLDAAGDADLDGAGPDQVVDQVRGLLARAALGVDRGGPGVLGEPGVQPGAADHVVGLLAGLGDAPADHLLDLVGSTPARSSTSRCTCAEEHGRVHAGQPAAALAERGADGLDDDRVSHGPKARTRSYSAARWTLEIRRPIARRVFRTNREYVTIATRTCFRIREVSAVTARRRGARRFRPDRP